VQLKLYSAVAIPVFIYGIAAYTMMTWDQGTLQAAELCFL
jgi:hypothetical protein